MLAILGWKGSGKPGNEGGILLNLFSSSAKGSSLSAKERQAYTPLYSSAAGLSDDDFASAESSIQMGPDLLSRLGTDRITSPPPGYLPPSRYPYFLPRFPRKRPSRRCAFVLTILTIASALYICTYTFFRPPNYIILPPEKYLQYLNDTLHSHIPTENSREALSRHLEQIRYPPPSIFEPGEDASNPITRWNLVPKTIWSSDGKPAPAAWSAKWRQMGAEPRFLDDAGAEAWVERFWHGTEVKKAWDEMPRFILKADLLRYLLLLSEGGTWSDMDTVPLMPVASWADDAVPLASTLSRESDSFNPMVGSPSSHWKKHEATRARRINGKHGGMVNPEREPIRAVIGIETDPTETASPRALLERLRIVPMNRHRSLQFVQWTMHFAPNHPILLDVVRRILQASEIHRAREAEKERESFTDGWGWNEQDPHHRSEQAKLRKAHTDNAWETIRYKWKWEAGAWRWGWDANSIEEWTGPSAWTDAVVSYLYASAGVRPEDLVGLKQPVQIRDVVILPTSGFNPRKGKTKKDSRLIHLFRGSWKD